jgi:hypothetical protein
LSPQCTVSGLEEGKYGGRIREKKGEWSNNRVRMEMENRRNGKKISQERQ